MSQQRSDTEGEGFALALMRGLEILSCFSESSAELSVSDLSSHLGLNVGTVHRLVTTLEHAQYLTQQEKRGKYKLGHRSLGVAKVVLNTLPVRIKAVPIMRELALTTTANCSLAVLIENDITYIERIPSPKIDDPYHHIGRRAPAYCTAMGKMVLALSPRAVVDRVVEQGLAPLTERTIVDPDALRSALDTIRAEGFAVDDSEYMPGSYCIAGPIVDGTGKVVASLSLSTTRTFLNRDGLHQHTSRLLQSCTKVSHQLGYGLFDPRTV